MNEKDLSFLVEDYWTNMPTVEIEIYLKVVETNFDNIQYIPEPYKSIFKKHKNKTLEQLKEIYPEFWLWKYYTKEETGLGFIH